MVSALVSGSRGPGSSPGRGDCVVFLGVTLYCLSIQVNKWVPANEFNAETRVIYRISGEISNVPSRFLWSWKRREISASLMGPLAHIYGLLTKHEIKMAGYWPSSFLACLWTQTGSDGVHKLAKKERGQYPTILIEKAWSIKDLLFGLRGKSSRETRRVIPSGQDSSILPAWVANPSAWFGSSCPLTKLAIQ